MTRFAKYCRTLLAGSLVFGGAVAISVVGASLSASPAAAAAPPAAPPHSVISREGPLRSARPLRSKGLLKSILPTLGASGNADLGGTLDLPEGGNGDPSAWTVEKSANVLAKEGVINSDSCGSASNCVAVGYSFDKAGIQEALAEAWNGSKWSVEKLPKTPGDLGSEFLGVSCRSATACTAVGAYRDTSGVQVSLAEVWNGTSWSIETTPNPSGAQVIALQAVSCSSSSNCIAVGGSEDSSYNLTTLVEKRKGKTWSIEASPNPSGSEGTVLKGVSCTSGSACTAVGTYFDSSGNEDTLAEVWNGTSWSIETTPNPSGVDTSALDGVSCTSTGPCSAVGGYVDSSGAQESLAEEWNGTAWSLEATPNPSGAEESVLAAVACTSNGTCTAVGGFIDSSGPELTLAEGWNGSSWSVQTTPDPSGSEGSALDGVACNSAGGCTAAGTSIDSLYVEEVSLVEAWNATSWSIQASANSKGAAADADLLGVACTSASACTAVGLSAFDADAILAEAWNGTSWSIQPTPSPSGSKSAALEGVACTAANACTAVGFYEDSSGVYMTLAEAWNGTSWSVQTTPVPSGAENSNLTGVACTSTNACTAVGNYNDSSGTEDTLAEAWNGTSWSVETTPAPSGAEGSNLTGVACTSTNACTAVGNYNDSSGTEDTLAEAWDGTSWSIETTPVPSGAQSSYLSGVSCTSAGPCTAVGDYTDSSGDYDALAEAWNGTSWSIETTPVPLGAEGSFLDGVACTSTGDCTAVGDYADSSGNQDTLAEVWNGTSWSVQTTPGPTGGGLPTLSGVACTSADGCTAAGDYGSVSGIYLTLVEVGPSP